MRKRAGAKSAEREEQQNSKEKISRLLYNSTFGTFLILIAVFLILVFVKGNVFLSASNLSSVFRQFSFTAIAAMGVALVIITGGIDLSIGSVLALSGVISTMAVQRIGADGGVNGFVCVCTGVIISMGCGALVGAINGVLITRFEFPAFIATLGMMSVARGMTYVISEGYPVSNKVPSFKILGQGTIAGIPTPVIIMFLVAILFSLLLHKTVVGRRIYAIGGNEEAAKFSGINVRRVKMFAYVVCGMMAGFTGLLTSSRLGVAQAIAGDGMEMDAIAAVIIGGASLSGGVGNAIGPLMGAAIMGFLDNALVLLEVNAYWQEGIIGGVIILAIFLDRLRYKRRR